MTIDLTKSWYGAYICSSTKEGIYCPNSIEPEIDLMQLEGFGDERITNLSGLYSSIEETDGFVVLRTMRLQVQISLEYARSRWVGSLLESLSLSFVSKAQIDILPDVTMPPSGFWAGEARSGFIKQISMFGIVPVPGDRMALYMRIDDDLAIDELLSLESGEFEGSVAIRGWIDGFERTDRVPEQAEARDVG